MSIAQPTLEDVWQLFRETDRLLKEQSAETNLKFQETDRRFQETERFLKEQSAETDRRFEESDREWQETKRFLKELSAETDRRFKETDRKFQETDRRFKETDRKFQETDRKLKEVAKQIGSLGNRLGDFVEEMVRPAVVRLFQKRNIEVHQVLQNLTAYDSQHRMKSQIDLVALNTIEAVVVECKSQLSIDDVNEHLERLEYFKINFPQYTAFRIVGAVAAMVLPENVGQYAARKGLFLLAQSGEAIVIQNDTEFVPKQW